MKQLEFTEEQIKMLSEAVSLTIAIMDASENYSIREQIPAYKTLLNYIEQ